MGSNIAKPAGGFFTLHSERVSWERSTLSCGINAMTSHGWSWRNG